MKYILYIIIFFLISCKSQFNFENSTFFYRNKVGNTSLINFYKNGTFRFLHKEGLIEVKSMGTWRKIENKIILQSDKSYKTGIISSKEQIDNTFNKVKVIIKDSIGFISGACIVLDKTKKCNNTNNKGSVLVLNKPNIITIYYLGEKYDYFIKNKESNIIEINIILNNLSLEYFDNEEWIINKNTITNSWNEKMVLKKNITNTMSR